MRCFERGVCKFRGPCIMPSQLSSFIFMAKDGGLVGEDG